MTDLPSPLHVSPRPIPHPSFTLQSLAASSLVAASERNFFGPAYYSPFPPTSTSDPLLYALTLYQTTPIDTLTSRLRHLQLDEPPLLSTTTYPYDFPSPPFVAYFYATYRCAGPLPFAFYLSPWTILNLLHTHPPLNSDALRTLFSYYQHHYLRYLVALVKILFSFNNYDLALQYIFTYLLNLPFVPFSCSSPF